MKASQEFYLRRLHSLTGILMGLFLFNHFLTNSFIIFGREAFNHKVGLIHSIPALVFVEIALIAVPFLIHMIYGVLILLDSKNNLKQYPYGRNWMYTLQRVTAWILGAFIIWHIVELRFYVYNVVDHYVGGHGHDGEFVLGGKFYDYLVMKFESPLFAIGYTIGIVAAIIHWCNGICTFLMTWGVTIGPRSQKLAAVFALCVALLFTAMIGASINGLIVPRDAPQAIKELHMFPTDEVPGSIVMLNADEAHAGGALY